MAGIPARQERIREDQRVSSLQSLAEPRFGGVAKKSGHYESYYLKAGDPNGRRAVWIRYTVHKRPGQQPQGSIWLTLFDPVAKRPLAVKQTAAPGDLTAGSVASGELAVGQVAAGEVMSEESASDSDMYLSIGELGEFSPTHARGRISGHEREAAWDLSLADCEAPLEHMPRRLYDTPLPRTKLLTLQPAAIFSGWVDFGGHRIQLDAWPGMVGHNWGAQHAEQWVWLHGTGFDGRGADSWIDMAMGRLKIGPWITPWIANGAISVDGVRHGLGGLGRVRATQVDARAGRCTFKLPGDDLTVLGTVIAAPDDTAAWIYSDPDGSQHHTLNCSIANLELTFENAGGATPTVLTTGGGAVYEFGSRNTDHGIPLEPFDDG